MKQFILSLFLIGTIKSYCQPNPSYGYCKRINEISKILKTDSLNYPLIYERAWKAVGLKENNFYMQECKQDSLLFDTADFILKDLTLLIERNISFEEYGIVSLSHFYKLRGRYFQLNNESKKALSDFYSSFSSTPQTNYPELSRIYSIISDTYFSESKYLKALIALDSANIYFKKEIENSYKYVFKEIEYNERQKIEILRNIGNEDTLINYYKFLIAGYKEKYKEALLTQNRKEESFRIDYLRTTFLNYQYTLIEFYFEKGEVEIAKNELLKVLPTLPKTIYGFPLEIFDNGAFHFLLGRIEYGNHNYAKAFEEYLIAYGDPMQSRLSDTAIINKLIKKHPKEPKLYLIRAAMYLRNNYSSNNKASNMNIAAMTFRELDKAKKLGYKGYRIPYFKAIAYTSYFKDQKKTLIEINKAISSAPEVPFFYSVKSGILRNLKYNDSRKQDLEVNENDKLFQKYFEERR